MGSLMTLLALGRGNVPLLLWGLFTLFACLYFTYSAVRGPYGLFEKGRVEAHVVLLEDHLDHLSSERMAADNRARRMSDQFLDLDLLDEQVRKIIGMARADEIILR